MFILVPRSTPELRIDRVGSDVLSRDVCDFFLFWDKKKTSFIHANEKTLFWITGRCADLHLERLKAIQSIDDVEAYVQALKRSNGTFAYVLEFDKTHIISGTDAMGFHPFYYTSDASHPAMLSTSITHLKRRLKSPKPDMTSWNLIINGGSTIGRMTTISGVSRLREGERISIETSGVNGQQSPLKVVKFDFYKPMAEMAMPDFIEENNKRLKQSVKELVADIGGYKRVIPITAGHDSRRLASTSMSLDLPFHGITQQTAHASGLDIDTFVAKEVMEMLGLSESHDCLSMPEHAVKVTHALEKDYWSGFESEQHDWAVNMLNAMPTPSVIADGIVGDWAVNTDMLIKSPHLLQYYNDPSNLAISFMKSYKVMPFLQGAAGDKSGEDERLDVLTRHMKEYESTGHMLVTYMVFNRARRNLSCWYNPFLLNGHQMALPYTSVDVFEQSLSLPISARTDVTQSHCLAAANPKHAQLHSSRSDVPDLYWATLGAKPTPKTRTPFHSSQVRITDATYGLLARSPKERLMDTLGMLVCPERLAQSHEWRYRPLQRLAIFLEWLDSDESQLPILSMETPAFIKKRSLAPTTITK